ncbi:VOC family protein [Dactylosporangium sp. CS-047395]|uniref:VOC family protein n=1 Tax=Dactylosporangium sp. CS-047395 TaxID=3239936 RepID=UPI003D9000E9
MSVVFDTPGARVGAEVDFWSAALGTPAWSPPGEEQFTALVGAVPDFFTVVQAVGDGDGDGDAAAGPRYHVDIETDDLAAEVARLTALGAESVSRWKDAFAMRSPGGHVFCVVPVHSDPETFARTAHTWP